MTRLEAIIKSQGLKPGFFERTTSALMKHYGLETLDFTYGSQQLRIRRYDDYTVEVGPIRRKSEVNDYLQGSQKQEVLQYLMADLDPGAVGK